MNYRHAGTVCLGVIDTARERTGAAVVSIMVCVVAVCLLPLPSRPPSAFIMLAASWASKTIYILVLTAVVVVLFFPPSYFGILRGLARLSDLLGGSPHIPQ